MTNFSSFVMPASRAEVVCAIVVMSVLPLVARCFCRPPMRCRIDTRACAAKLFRKARQCLCHTCLRTKVFERGAIRVVRCDKARGDADFYEWRRRGPERAGGAGTAGAATLHGRLMRPCRSARHLTKS